MNTLWVFAVGVLLLSWSDSLGVNGVSQAASRTSGTSGTNGGRAPASIYPTAEEWQYWYKNDPKLYRKWYVWYMQEKKLEETQRAAKFNRQPPTQAPVTRSPATTPTQQNGGWRQRAEVITTTLSPWVQRSDGTWILRRNEQPSRRRKPEAPRRQYPAQTQGNVPPASGRNQNRVPQRGTNGNGNGPVQRRVEPNIRRRQPDVQTANQQTRHAQSQSRGSPQEQYRSSPNRNSRIDAGSPQRQDNRPGRRWRRPTGPTRPVTYPTTPRPVSAKPTTKKPTTKKPTTAAPTTAPAPTEEPVPTTTLEAEEIEPGMGAAGATTIDPYYQATEPYRPLPYRPPPTNPPYYHLLPFLF